MSSILLGTSLLIISILSLFIGVMGAREVIENELIKELDVYKNGKIVYFIEHANVWNTSTGGVHALDTMMADLEGALLN